ncbi:hypothetical protein [uncultured Muribaculum sp.]|uniref:hypothetical protein n=1 Tax=uncultured Muribaculum sp. TaxID=1918613 RepID=UPI00266F092F|nr:hypothetical protein [uncultured Muribaculum sp.]
MPSTASTRDAVPDTGRGRRGAASACGCWDSSRSFSSCSHRSISFALASSLNLVAM